MTAKIIPFRGAELIPVIESWLEQARRGEIVSMAFVALLDDDTTCEGWTGDIERSTVQLYGAINILRDGFFHERIEHFSSADLGGK